MSAKRLALAVGLAVIGLVLSWAWQKRGATASPLRPAPPCLAGIVTHHEHAEGDDGITRDLVFRDRFVRCQDDVWVERITPPADTKATRADGHGLPPMHRLARHVHRTKDGGSTLALVDRARGRVVDVDRGSFESVGHDPRFARAFTLLPPGLLETLKPAEDAPRAASGHETRRLERRDERGYLRVDWSEKDGIALAIASGRTDGTQHDEVAVTLEEPPAERPWEHLGKLAHVDFSDLGD